MPLEKENKMTPKKKDNETPKKKDKSTHNKEDKVTPKKENKETPAKEDKMTSEKENQSSSSSSDAPNVTLLHIDIDDVPTYEQIVFISESIRAESVSVSAEKEKLFFFMNIGVKLTQQRIDNIEQYQIHSEDNFIRWFNIVEESPFVQKSPDLIEQLSKAKLACTKNKTCSDQMNEMKKNKPSIDKKEEWDRLSLDREYSYQDMILICEKVSVLLMPRQFTAFSGKFHRLSD